MAIKAHEDRVNNVLFHGQEGKFMTSVAHDLLWKLWYSPCFFNLGMWKGKPGCNPSPGIAKQCTPKASIRMRVCWCSFQLVYWGFGRSGYDLGFADGIRHSAHSGTCETTD